MLLFIISIEHIVKVYYNIYIVNYPQCFCYLVCSNTNPISTWTIPGIMTTIPTFIACKVWFLAVLWTSAEIFTLTPRIILVLHRPTGFHFIFISHRHIGFIRTFSCPMTRFLATKAYILTSWRVLYTWIWIIIVVYIIIIILIIFSITSISLLHVTLSIHIIMWRSFIKIRNIITTSIITIIHIPFAQRRWHESIIIIFMLLLNGWSTSILIFIVILLFKIITSLLSPLVVIFLIIIIIPLLSTLVVIFLIIIITWSLLIVLRPPILLCHSNLYLGVVNINPIHFLYSLFSSIGFII